MLKKIYLLVGLFMASAAMAAVDVNKATAADLDGLPGIGPATTQLILTERKKGEFKDWPDLMRRVKGIGQARAASLSDAGMTVGGMGYKGKGKVPSTTLKSSADKPATGTPVMTPAAVSPVDRGPEKSAPAR